MDSKALEVMVSLVSEAGFDDVLCNNIKDIQQGFTPSPYNEVHEPKEFS